MDLDLNLPGEQEMKFDAQTFVESLLNLESTDTALLPDMLRNHSRCSFLELGIILQRSLGTEYLFGGAMSKIIYT